MLVEDIFWLARLSAGRFARDHRVNWPHSGLLAILSAVSARPVYSPTGFLENLANRPEHMDGKSRTIIKLAPIEIELPLFPCYEIFGLRTICELTDSKISISSKSTHCPFILRRTIRTANYLKDGYQLTTIIDANTILAFRLVIIN